MALKSKHPPVLLVVDDDPGFGDSLRDLLAEEGYQVCCANDGLEALELLRELPRPCLILMDLLMPRMDGWEFLARLRAEPRWSTVPVVALSAFPNMPHPLGAQRFLEKPVQLEALLSLIEEHCGHGAHAQNA